MKRQPIYRVIGHQGEKTGRQYFTVERLRRVNWFFTDIIIFKYWVQWNEYSILKSNFVSEAEARAKIVVLKELHDIKTEKVYKQEIK